MFYGSDLISQLIIYYRGFSSRGPLKVQTLQKKLKYTELDLCPSKKTSMRSRVHGVSSQRWLFKSISIGLDPFGRRFPLS
jgi:hypothetical protein